MKAKKKIALLGATGKAGKFILTQLLSLGHPVNILLRDPSKLEIQHQSLRIVKGDVRQLTDLLALLNGCEALISALGQPKGEDPIFSQACTQIIHALELKNIKRYIAVTGLSIDVPSDKKSSETQQKSDLMRQYFPEIIADKQKEYQLLNDSPIEWTLARIPFLLEEAGAGNFSVCLEDCTGEKIYAGDLASFVCSQLWESKYILKAPFIASNLRRGNSNF